jgi:hypothetical protein
MFDLLKKYENAGHFFFSASDDLQEVCNAPTDKAGAYLVYALRKGKIELVYIGSSGLVKEDGKLHMREGGIKERIINGEYGDINYNILWSKEMVDNSIDALDIYWYVTYEDTHTDCPKDVEDELFDRYYDLYEDEPAGNIKEDMEG